MLHKNSSVEKAGMGVWIEQNRTEEPGIKIVLNIFEEEALLMFKQLLQR